MYQGQLLLTFSAGGGILVEFILKQLGLSVRKQDYRPLLRVFLHPTKIANGVFLLSDQELLCNLEFREQMLLAECIVA